MRRWLRLLLGICAGQFILLIILSGLWLLPGDRPQPQRVLKSYSRTNQEPYFAGHPGPWGELEYARINLEPTDEFAQAEEKILAQTRWFFGGQSREQVVGLFASLNLPATQQSELLERSQWQVTADGTLIEPTGDLIMNLPAESRARIYSVLARNRRNDLHVWPFVYRQSGFEDWVANSSLAPTTLALVRQVIYHRGAALCVSDAPELCQRIADPAERLRLIKTLSRTATLIMKVRVRPDTDVPALTAYWGRGWHVKDIEPLLASLTKVPGSISLDIAHLLPPFARKRLNSYPTPPEPGQRAPDCYWTAWNFFRDPPDDRYFDDSVWRQELQQHCQRVAQPTFGDLVFLTRPDGVPIHSAVFIADDVVFTKNGANLRQPWKLMKMEDLLARYPEDFPLQVAFFRPQSPPP